MSYLLTGEIRPNGLYIVPKNKFPYEIACFGASVMVLVVLWSSCINPYRNALQRNSGGP